MNSRTIEIGVGLFVACGLAALFMLAMQVSNLAAIGGSGDSYTVTAAFENVGGLKVRAPVTVSGVRVVNVFPHDPTAYCQGLVYVDGMLYEGTGKYGESTLRKVDLQTGKVTLEEARAEQDFVYTPVYVRKIFGPQWNMLLICMKHSQETPWVGQACVSFIGPVFPGHLLLFLALLSSSLSLSLLLSPIQWRACHPAPWH